MTASDVGNVLTAAGYLVAVPVLVRVRTIVRLRRRTWYGVLQGGMAGLVVGHLLARRPVASALNAAGALVLAWVWRRTARPPSSPGGDVVPR